MRCSPSAQTLERVDLTAIRPSPKELGGELQSGWNFTWWSLETIGLENIPIVELLTLYFNACYAVEIGSHATGSRNVGGRIQRT